jgi:hypothetical protein
MREYYRKQFLVPDALFILRHKGRAHFIMLEMDRGTISSKWMVARYQSYYDWWREKGHQSEFKVNSIRILTVTQSQKRMENLLKGCCRVKAGAGSALFWFTTMKNVDIFKPEQLIKPIWRKALPNDSNLYSLLD